MTFAVQALPFGVLVADRAGSGEYANAGWEELFDEPNYSWRGRSWQEVLPPAVATELREDIRFGREHRADVIVGHPNARPRTLALRAVPTSDGGRRMWVVTAADVTLERQHTATLVERATHDAMTGLYNRAQFLEFLGHALDRQRRDPEGVAAVLFIDVDHLKQTNDALGHEAGDRLLQDVATQIRAAVRPVDVVARYGGDEFAVLCEDLVAAEEAHHIATRVAGFVNSSEGDVVRAISVGVAIADDPECEPASIVRAADADMYRVRSRDPVRSAHRVTAYPRVPPDREVAATSRVLAATAHELKTPLTSIIGYAQTLRSEAPRMAPDAVDRSLETIERQGTRVARILDDLLDIGRIRNAPAVAVATVDLGAVVRDAMDAAPPPGGVTVIDGVSGGPTRLVSATGEGDLSRLVVNLLTNAYRHGGFTVELTARAGGPDAELLVTDDGPGVPEDLASLIFQPFVRGRGDDAGGGGTGLGLSLASAIAAASGGTLTYAPVLPHGARFVLRLPAQGGRA